MALKSSTFQGIVKLNPSIAHDLDDYLQEKESQTAAKILAALNPHFELEEQFSDIQNGKVTFTFSALGELLKQDEANISSSSTAKSLEKNGLLIRKLNIFIWEYLEIIEESATEFFQQIDQNGMEDWNAELADAVKSIKYTLVHHLDSLQYALGVIEHHLHLLRKKDSRILSLRFLNFVHLWVKYLDSSIFSHVDKCKKYVEFRFQRFSDFYEHYCLFQTKIDRVAVKFNNYSVFASLDNETQSKFLKNYRLVKFWELNNKTKSLPQREIVKSLRFNVAPETSLEDFKCYFHHLKNAIFDISKQLKSPNIQANLDELLSKENETLLGYRHELHTLGATLAKYRNLLLSTDPNPYVRSRMGFAEWVMGPEPNYTKKMLELSYEIENTDNILEAFLHSLNQNEKKADDTVEELKSDILCILHEMGQPLMSKPMMKLRAEHLVNLLEQLDEVSTRKADLVDFIEQALIKALKGDWKYQVLFSMPKFHKLYAIHQGILQSVNTPKHLRRKEKFTHCISQVEMWVEQHDTPKRTEEIELNLHDIKIYLQEFLAEVQFFTAEKSNTPESIQELRSQEHQLLEYRYLFGSFFHRLHEKQPEDKILRQCFLFVDQYFETIETLFQEFRNFLTRE